MTRGLSASNGGQTIVNRWVDSRSRAFYLGQMGTRANHHLLPTVSVVNGHPFDVRKTTTLGSGIAFNYLRSSSSRGLGLH
ncbi:hypothetical protein CEXT_498041 [Caerostris extrusa]|uniref:Uncharacterized protein n=1 Tax=Caerostris extrusa TaxID=172846 RepID=A0AAV4M3V5_CAEEX|nr:hypothetical protein CEXT_498041 [Caerostris extrusa]